VHDTIARRKNIKGPAVVDATVHFAKLPRDGVTTRTVGARDGTTRCRVLEAVKHVSSLPVLDEVPSVFRGTPSKWTEYLAVGRRVGKV
jgi:hypothetical protein